MELHLLKACLAERTAYSLIDRYITPNKYSREFRYLHGFISDYYSRDVSASSVDLPLLKELIKSSVANEKHYDRFAEMLDRAVGTETSVDNVVSLVLMAKKHELSIALATHITNDDPQEKIAEVIEQYREIAAATTLSDIDSGAALEIIENINAEELINDRRAEGSLLKLYPSVINDKIDGGLEAGDHVVIYGVTEIGKSAVSITAACGFATQGARGLYLGNEDKISRMALRMVSCLSGMNKYEIEKNPAEAQRRAEARGLENIKLIGITPGNVPQIAALVEKYDPAWVIVDQLRNLDTPSRNNRVVQLEEAATGMRTLGKEAGVRVISVTQAGDSASNKLFLETGDVDFSNVGIPGTADLMIGVGATPEHIARNERGISLPKNKLSGDHAQLIVRINTALSRVT